MNPWTMARRHDLADSCSDVVMGSPATSSGLLVGSPSTTNGPLQHLCDMFPEINSDTIHSVFQRSGRNPSVCAEMLLSIHPLSHAGDYPNFAEPFSSSSFNIECSVDPFRGLPLETVKMIAKYLTLFDLAVFGCVNHECKRLAEEELCTVTMLHNASGMRQSSDERILNMLARFPRLTNVSLYKCADFQNFTLLPAALRNAHITSLNLAFCDHLNDDDVRVIMLGLPELQQLDLSGTFISDEGLEHISAFGADRLKRLVLSGCTYISDLGVTFVYTRCSALEQLDLRSTHIRPTALEPGPNAANLMKLVMSSCKRISRVLLTNGFESLRSLVLSTNQNMTSVNLDLPNLTFLNLSSSKQLRALTVNSPLLIVLNLSGCSRLSDADFIALALTRINLYNCRSLPLNSIVSLIRGCARFIQDIDLRGCPQLVDDETEHLARLCPAIQRFDVTGCKTLTPAGIASITRIIQAATERRARLS